MLLPASPARRRLPVRFAATLACLASALAVAGPARADDPSTVTVVGTSDLYDSGLVQNVLQPGFERAYPQYHLNYVSKGSGAAIAYAEAGTASALVVHAASLENQFVAGGYSRERYGRAIFYGDYVLLGPAADPAGVLTNAPHDVVSAFERIAQAGAANRANFVSRGGTPGTTVEEHQIWAMTQGVTTCRVSDVNGGGASPSTATGDCPSSTSYPSWYHATGLTQGPNITAADACGFPNGNCYVLTDRGTFNYLQSQGSAKSLKIVTRDNAASARGGSTLLVNSFHAYALNPAKFAGQGNVQINVAGAEAFLNYLTSPATQRAVRRYLGGAGDPPFLPDAAPALTASKLPRVRAAGKVVTVRGRLRNLVPGTPALSNVRVTLTSTSAGRVARARTDGSGRYRLRFRARSSGIYTVSTGRIAKIEDSTLDPVFGDLLAPARTTVGRLRVQGGVKITSVRVARGRALVSGRVSPRRGHNAGRVTITARKGHSGRFLAVISARLASAQGHFTISTPLKPGAYGLRARFTDPATILRARSATRNVTVPGTAAVRIGSVRVHRGRVTVRGSLVAGGRVALLARTVRRLHGLSLRSAPLARVGGTRTVAAGGSFTLHARLRRGTRWQVAVSSGRSVSRLRSVKVR